MYIYTHYNATYLPKRGAEQEYSNYLYTYEEYIYTYE